MCQDPISLIDTQTLHKSTYQIENRDNRDIVEDLERNEGKPLFYNEHPSWVVPRVASHI